MYFTKIKKILQLLAFSCLFSAGIVALLIRSNPFSSKMLVDIPFHDTYVVTNPISITLAITSLMAIIFLIFKK